MINAKYRLCLSFQGSLELNSIEYLRFSNGYEKANKETHALTEWHIIRYRLIDSETIENVSYLHAAIVQIPMKCFKEHALIMSGGGWRVLQKTSNIFCHIKILLQ